MHKVHNLNHHFLFHKHWNPEILEYYFYQIFSRIATTLSNVFLPVYLYAELNYSIFQIMLFFGINQLYFILFVPFAGKVIEKFGVKHTIALHIPFMALFWYLLRFLTPGFYENWWFIVLILAFRAIPKSFLETAEVVFISKNLLAKEAYGVSLAKLRGVLIVAALLSPLLGGAITHFLGYDMLFNSAIVILLFSAIPFFLTKDKHFHISLRVKKVWDVTMHRLPKNFMYAEFGRVFADSAMWLLWPLFLFIIVVNTLDLGILVTISGLASLIVAYFVGKRVDTYEPKNLLKRSVRVATGIFYSRTLFASPVLIAFTDIANRIIEPVFMVPYQKFLYKYINSFKDIVQISNAKVLLTEIGYTIGTFILAGIFFIVPRFGIEETHPFLFILTFLLFGMAILLMTRIVHVTYAGEGEA